MHVTRLLLACAAFLFCATASAEESGGGGSGGSGSGGAGGGQESRNIEFEMTTGTRTQGGSDSMLSWMESMLGGCTSPQHGDAAIPEADCSPDESR